MPDEDDNFGGSLVWILESDDFTCNAATQEEPQSAFCWIVETIVMELTYFPLFGS